MTLQKGNWPTYIYMYLYNSGALLFIALHCLLGDRNVPVNFLVSPS